MTSEEGRMFTYWAWTHGCRPTCMRWCSGGRRGHRRVRRSCVLWPPPWCIVTLRHHQTCTTAERDRMIDGDRWWLQDGVPARDEEARGGWGVEARYGWGNHQGLEWRGKKRKTREHLRQSLSHKPKCRIKVTSHWCVHMRGVYSMSMRLRVWAESSCLHPTLYTNTSFLTAFIPLNI